MSIQPFWDAWSEAIGQAVRDTEVAIGEVLDGVSLATAVGVQLNRWGEVVRLPRAGLDDDIYRRAIRVRIATLYSSGTIPEILDIVTDLLPGQDTVFEETPPAAFVLKFIQLTGPEAMLLCRILSDVPSAGVRADLETNDPGMTAGFGYTPAPTPDLGTGAYTTGTSVALGNFSPYSWGVPVENGSC